ARRSRARPALLRPYGAEVHETPSLGGMNEAIELANRLAEEHDGFIPQQFSNPANPEIHRRRTAEEIWRGLDGGGGEGGAPGPSRKSPASRRRPRCSPAASRARTRSRGSGRASSRRCSIVR